ncbi:MAG: cycloartenol synthase-like protein [Verrucomicrobiales bacterium]|nr:cycloartenol synthase-like protein [Verrucomicrobiales bacterium]
MRRILLFLLLASFASQAAVKNENASLRNEVQHAIDKGLASLEKTQGTNGTWNADQPAVTALVVTAFNGEPSGRFQKQSPEFLKKSYAYLLSCAKPDGSIYNKKELLNYNTAVATMAFVTAKNPEYRKTIVAARNFLAGSQNDFGEHGKVDNVFDGGVGYGSHYDHSDLNNTLLALEAMYYSKDLARDTDAKDLDWQAAIHFLQSCQNLPGINKEKWASDDPQNKGGFIYYPEKSMAGETTNANGRVAFRSYGSASYAGLLSYIYADLKPNDPRVKAVAGWLDRNFTLEENPGMGPQGLYYYYHTMAKALTLSGVNTIETSDGKKINWREQLALKLINLQKADGSWANENGRWWEKDPALVTSYAVIALELIHRGL